MELKARYDLIIPFIDKWDFDTREELISIINDKESNSLIEILDEEKSTLENLMKTNKICLSYLGEFAWFYINAKSISRQEKQTQKDLDVLRNGIYFHPQLFHDKRKQKAISEKELLEIWEKSIENEKKISEEKKQDRDRKLYNDLKKLTDVLSYKKDCKQISFKFEKEAINVTSEYLIYVIQESLKRISIDDIKSVIDIIGENQNAITQKKINRQNFAVSFHNFLKYNFGLSISDYKRYQIIAGIMFFGGLDRPTNQKNPLKYEIEKNNEEYRKYVKDTLIKNTTN